MKEFKEIDGVKKEWEIMEFEDNIRWLSYEKLDKVINAIGSGLMKWATGLKFGDRIGLYMDTRREWIQTAMAAFQHGVVIATCYASLGEDALIHVINECELSLIVTDHNFLKTLESIGDKCPTLKRVVYVGITETDHKSNYYELISFGNLSNLGSEALIRPERPPERDSTAVIMYTSGSTGTPKGVIISHNAIVSFSSSIGQSISLTPKDCYLAYLPLAHIFELGAEFCMYTYGVKVVYGSARTLTDKFCRPCGDIQAAKPTILTGVPRVFETIRKGILQKTSSSGYIKKSLFDRAYQSKLRALKAGQVPSSIWDTLIFNKIKAKLGVTNLRTIVSGGAPLNADTMDFLRVVFGCGIAQGYGLTETCAGGSIQDPTQHSVNNVGFPIRSCEIRLVDVPDMGYYHTDNPPRGEICIKGHNVADGYYKDPVKTAEVFKNGWFFTGDIGEWNPDGTLSIIDRKKNLVKLAHGEYIALENLEMILNNSPYVAPNGICLYADSYKDFAVAIVQPHFSGIANWAQENGIPTDDIKSLITNPALKKEIISNLKQICLDYKKKNFEIPANVHIVDVEWTPENGALTAAMKLNRQNIYKMWKSDIDQLYAEGSLLNA